MKQSTCEAPNIRNIAGKGLTSVFKSTTKRLIEKPKSDNKLNNKESKNADKISMFLDSQYVRLILRPKRQTLSFRVAEKNEKPGEIPDVKFNTTATILPRQRVRTNKAVAFLSSCPRFEGDGGKATFLANKSTSKKTKSSISLKTVNVASHASKEGTERLARLPPRYQRSQLEDSRNDKLGNLFQHLPQPKILLKQINFNFISTQI